MEVVLLLKVPPFFCPKNGHVAMCSNIFSTAIPSWIFRLLEDELRHRIIEPSHILSHDIQ
jgi:hypothetical protein